MAIIGRIRMEKETYYDMCDEYLDGHLEELEAELKELEADKEEAEGVIEMLHAELQRRKQEEKSV